MSRIDEMIYYLDTQVKLYGRNPILFSEQNIMGKDRLCCATCGHCPEAEAELLREIRDEVRAKTKPSRKLAKRKENK